MDGHDEKENTPTLVPASNGNHSIHSQKEDKSSNQINLIDGQDKLPINEEDRDNRQRHKEALEALTHIEEEFARLREKMYQEKMQELNEEAIMIANGTHPELITLMAEIEEKKGKRISTAETWRECQHANFKRQFEGFEYQANINFIARRNAMKRDLLSSVDGKRWRIEDEIDKLSDPLQKPGKVIPDIHKLRTQKQVRREETMELQDIKDVIGFPRAPQVPGLSHQDIYDDLLALGLDTGRHH
ncbi:hypothetical protein BJ944DRAFT_267069 [Cunninghamella echinulata]|nr:hypothetical protein BJ944DRAFT_267069 [Cunninghamella echinulata]